LGEALAKARIAAIRAARAQGDDEAVSDTADNEPGVS
jgi:hypothetical protein